MSAQLRKALFVLTLGMMLAAALPCWVSAAAEKLDLPDGSKLDTSVKCPVCNMEPGSSKDIGAAAVVLKDGKVVGLDGPSHMFMYLLTPDKHPLNKADVKHIFALDYGTKKFIDANAAWFVVGSSVEGTMGPEAVPFAKKEDAEKFGSEHKGSRVVPFSQVQLSDVQAKGWKKMLKMKHGH
ncbi:MAG: hypothetical protein FJ118_09650 [Deltaproteobacteria bacterium]|nr:hypothetical protein [Deltaproteobacteria bacterium]